MEYISIKNLEKYHPGYKDRNLIWCKTYFTMINAEPEFEMLCEIDKWRFVAFVMLQLQIKRPVPIDKKYLTSKGFDLRKRPISLTLQMLHNFVECVTQDEKLCSVDIDKEEEEDKEEEVCNEVTLKDFIDYWNKQNKLPCVISATEERTSKFKLRCRDKRFVDSWRRVIDAVASSPFHTGLNDRGWRATIDYVLKNETIWVKLLEEARTREYEQESAERLRKSQAQKAVQKEKVEPVKVATPAEREKIVAASKFRARQKAE